MATEYRFYQQNYINISHHCFQRNDDPDVEDFGNKWSLGALLRYLKGSRTRHNGWAKFVSTWGHSNLFFCFHLVPIQFIFTKSHHYTNVSMFSITLFLPLISCHDFFFFSTNFIAEQISKLVILSTYYSNYFFFTPLEGNCCSLGPAWNSNWIPNPSWGFHYVFLLSHFFDLFTFLDLINGCIFRQVLGFCSFWMWNPVLPFWASNRPVDIPKLCCWQLWWCPSKTSSSRLWSQPSCPLLLHAICSCHSKGTVLVSKVSLQSYNTDDVCLHFEILPIIHFN